MLALRAWLLGLWQAIRSPRSVLLLYVAVLLFSAVAAAPAYRLAAARLANSPDAAALLLAFDPAFVEDFARVESEALELARAGLVAAALLHALVHVFLAGGVLASLEKRGRLLPWTGFFAACGRYALPFLRVLVPAAAALGVVVVMNDLASRGLTRLFHGPLQGASAGLLFWTLVAKTLFFLALLVLLVVAPVQLARARCVVDDQRDMLAGYWRGLVLAVRNPVTVLLFFALSALSMLGVVFLHHALLAGLDPSRPWRPFAGLDFSLEPWLVYLLGSQALVVVLALLQVQRAAGVLRIWKERAAPPAAHDPELVYQPVEEVIRGYGGPLAVDVPDRRRGLELTP